MDLIPVTDLKQWAYCPRVVYYHRVMPALAHPTYKMKEGLAYKTTGLHLPTDLWELLNRTAFERSRTKGGRASASAIIVELIERHRKELERELAAANR